MSVWDELRDGIAEIFDVLDLPATPVARTSYAAPTTDDFAAGRVGQATSTTFSVRALLDAKTVRANDGTFERVLKVITDSPLEIGDVLTFPTATYSVVSLEVIDPSPRANTNPLLFVSVLK